MLKAAFNLFLLPLTWFSKASLQYASRIDFNVLVVIVSGTTIASSAHCLTETELQASFYGGAHAASHDLLRLWCTSRNVFMFLMTFRGLWIALRISTAV